jgi:hypothetical protein
MAHGRQTGIVNLLGYLTGPAQQSYELSVRPISETPSQ